MFLTSYFVCYLFIAFHELSHIIFASFFGYKIIRVKLSIAGVCVSFKENNNITLFKKIIIYIAGPLSNICLAIIFYNVRFVCEINIFLAILNLMPIYPLDGYNILKSILEFTENIRYLSYFEKMFFIFLIVISICIMLYSYNPSLCVFCMYIMLIKIVTKNNIK